MARKLSFLLSLAILTVGAVFFIMSGAPQVGFAGQAPDQPHDPGAEVQGGVINTNEDVKVDVPLSANHNDGTIGCEELDFSTSNWTNGTVGAITDRPCNTTELAADVNDIGVYDPTASEDSAGADTCSDGIDNDSDGIDAADPDDCRLLIIPIVSIGGLNKGAGVVQIGDELISYTSSAPAGHSACGGDDTKGSGPACLTGITRGDFKTTAASHSAGDSVIFRSELGDGSVTTNLDSTTTTATSPAKGESLLVDSVSGFATRGVVLIDDELFIYDGTSNNKTPPDSLDNISSRGALGSTAAAHADNAHVFQIVPTSFATLFTDGIDSSQDTVMRLTGSLTGYGLNGGIVQLSNEIITYTQTGTTSAECDGPAPCLLGLTRGAFDTLAKGHAESVFVFTAAGDDIDQATANFTPANNYNDQALFDGVLSPNIIGGGMDVNGDGVIDSKDNSNQLLGASILSGLLDCDDFGTAPGNVGDGTIDASDDCTLTAEDGTTVITVVDGEFQLPDGPLALTFSVPDIDWAVINGRVDADGSGDIGSDDCSLSIVDESLPFNNNGTTKGTNREIDILSSDGTNNPCEGSANTNTANNGGVDIGSASANGNIGTEDDCSNGCFFGHNVVDGDVVFGTGAGGAGFAYTVGKDSLDSVPQVVDIRVDAVNDPPEADAKITAVVEQGATENEPTGDPAKDPNPETTITIKVTDVDNCELGFSVATADGVSNGALSSPVNSACTQNGADTDKDANSDTVTFTYVAGATFSGSDSFTLTVTDGKPGDPGDKDAEGIITIAVNVTNTLPTAGPVEKVTAQADGTETIVLTASDPDVANSGAPHCELNFSMVSFPENGNLSIIGSGFLVNNKCEPGSPNTDSAVVVYTPNSGYVGPDTFTYRVDDRTGKGDSISVVKVEINVVGAAPPGALFGDVNCDTVVDPLDALQILLWSAGLQTAQEPGCPQIGS